jgi:ribonuclease HI
MSDHITDVRAAIDALERIRADPNTPVEVFTDTAIALFRLIEYRDRTFGLGSQLAASIAAATQADGTK